MRPIAGLGCHFLMAWSFLRKWRAIAGSGAGRAGDGKTTRSSGGCVVQWEYMAACVVPTYMALAISKMLLPTPTPFVLTISGMEAPRNRISQNAPGHGESALGFSICLSDDQKQVSVS